MAQSKGGHPTKVEMEERMLEGILDEVANGKTLKECVAALGDKCKLSLGQVRAKILHHPELRERWQVAREMGAHAIFEEATELARQMNSKTWAKESHAEVSAKRAVLEHLRIAAAKLLPADYGDKQPAHPIVPIQIITSLDLGQANPPPKREEQNVYEVEVKK